MKVTSTVVVVLVLLAFVSDGLLCVCGVCCCRFYRTGIRVCPNTVYREKAETTPVGLFTPESSF